MAKRRIVSNELTTDKWFNRLSIEAQSLWPRLLACSDDFGVLPGDPEELIPLINCPNVLRKNFTKLIDELCVNLMWSLEYGGEKYIIFKPTAFDRHQSFIINKRTRSEYLKLQQDKVLEIFAGLEDSRKFQEIPGNTSANAKSESRPVESSKQKVESRKRGSAEGELPDFLEEMPTELKADSNLVQAWREFLHMRAFTRKNGKKPVRSLHAANALFKSLLKIRDPVSRVECVNLSTGEEWLSFIPEKFEKPNGQFVNAGNIKPKSSYEARLTFDPSSAEAERNRARLAAELTIAEREQRGSDQ